MSRVPTAGEATASFATSAQLALKANQAGLDTTNASVAVDIADLAGIVSSAPINLARTLVPFADVDLTGATNTTAAVQARLDAASARIGYSEVVTVTGTTTITSIALPTGAGFQPGGRRVTLIFAAALTVTGGSNLKLNGNMVTTADDTLTLVCDGTNWHETARSAN